MLESRYFIKTGTSWNLSEQQLVDCATKGNNGCGGGWMTNVYNYYTNTTPVIETEDYPYKGVDGNCQVPDDTLARGVRTTGVS
jgi:KDEL-tailed cysteine endopeptidase